MKQTTNYKLNKPELTDLPDITALNTNFDKIDSELKAHQDDLGVAVFKVNGETPDDTGEVIIDDYITSVTISGKTITVTKKDGTTTTLTTQDTVYTLPNATTSTKGGVKIGSNLTISSGTISLLKSNVTDALGYTPLQTAPVTSVNNKTGAVSVTASDISALPLDGSSNMTDTIKTSASQAMAKTNSSYGLGIYGGTSPTDGAYVVVYGKDSTEAGKFAICANNGTNKISLFGYADGTLTWNGNVVLTTANGLQLSGGAMTNAVAMTRNIDSDALQLHGGTGSANGAGLWLYGKDKANLQGTFRLRATAEGENVDLIGHRNGTLTWNGQNVERLNAVGSHYTKFESGMLICWGDGTTASNNIATVTFPMAFINNPHIVGNVIGDTSNDMSVMIRSYSATNFTALVNFDNTNRPNVGFRWIAIGRWK